MIFWEKSCFEVFGPKKAQNVSKMRFFKFYEKSMNLFFLIFSDFDQCSPSYRSQWIDLLCKWETLVVNGLNYVLGVLQFLGQNEVSWFRQNSCVGVFEAKKAAKWERNKFFYVLWQIEELCTYSYFFAWSSVKTWICLNQCFFFKKILFWVFQAEAILISR